MKRSQKPEARSRQTDSAEKYRIGKRTGQGRWQIKQGRGSWRVVHQCITLAEAAKWLTDRGVDIRLVPVIQDFPWKMLGKYVAEQSTEAKTGGARTQAEIDAEIAVLQDYKLRVAPGTFTDNRACIEAQIQVLREGLDNDAIYDRWPDEERDCETRMNASDAMDWMNGDKNEAPSGGWKELLQ